MADAAAAQLTDPVAPPPPQTARGGRLDRRHHDRVVRLLPLQHRRRPRLRAAVLQQQRVGRGAARVLDAVRRVRRPSARGRDLRPLRRPDRPQVLPRRHPADHGWRHRDHRCAAHLRDDRHLGADPADAAAGPAGHRRRRGVGRLGAHVDGVGHPQTARPHGGWPQAGVPIGLSLGHLRRLGVRRPRLPERRLALALHRLDRADRHRPRRAPDGARVARVRGRALARRGGEAAPGRGPQVPVARRAQGPVRPHRRAGAVLPVHLVRAGLRHAAARSWSAPTCCSTSSSPGPWGSSRCRSSDGSPTSSGDGSSTARGWC